LEEEKYQLTEELKDLNIKRMVMQDREMELLGGRSTRAYDKNLMDLKVVIVEGRKLSASDLMTGSSDPYILARLGGQVCKTTIKRTTLDPIWKETFTFNKLPREDTLLIEVYDYDAYKFDEIIGIKRINLQNIKINDIEDHWYELEDKDGHTGIGKVRIIIQLIEHVPPNFQAEIENIDKQIRAKEIEIEQTEDKLEVMQKPFAVFELEKREKENSLTSGGALEPNSGERALSAYMHKFTSESPWTTILLLAMFVYAFFTLCV